MANRKLYNHKQKWKITLLIVALLLVGCSLFFSNSIVSAVSQREKQKARQWADAIKKKIELVQLTNHTFNQLREKEREDMALWIEATKVVSQEVTTSRIPDYSFPLQIINNNNTIPVIVLDQNKEVSGSINIDFDTTDVKSKYPKLTGKKLKKRFEDSLVQLCDNWSKTNKPFTVEIYKNYFMTYYFSDSKSLVQLEQDRDELIASFNNDLINNKSTVPVVLVETRSDSIIGTNIPEIINEKKASKQFLNNLAKQNQPIAIDFTQELNSTLYFDISDELKMLQYFPYIQFLVIGLFVLIAYLIFSTFRKAEQNQVWAGMAKETAHQLGTPLSSLMAWNQLLEAQNTDPMITREINKDIERLERVTNRFSKIGSGGQMEIKDISITIQRVIDYLKPRISDKVELIIKNNPSALVKHNEDLFEWVIENICTNAVDAMQAKGTITIDVHHNNHTLHIDISDTGKGIPSGMFKQIFQPGFSTRKRGWGLGLSLSKRIIRNYHKGQVFVLKSELNVGSTFRISLPLNVL